MTITPLVTRSQTISADGVQVTLFTDGTTATVNIPGLTREADGSITYVDENATSTTFADITTARAALRWDGLVFSAAEKAAQRAFEDATPTEQFIAGRFQPHTHPALDGYLSACRSGDIAAAAQALDDHYTSRGFIQYAGVWAGRLDELVIVKATRNVQNTHSRPFVVGDLALARKERTGYVAFSARTLLSTSVPARDLLEV